MEIVILFIVLIIIIFILSMLEPFEDKDKDECSKINAGECNSKLCPSHCKIQHSDKNDNCYCVDRK
jgi:hypothetical protein